MQNNERDVSEMVSIQLPRRLAKKLEWLAVRHERTVSGLIEHALEIQYGEAVAAARLRVVDRLARLEASLGDAAELERDLARETFAFRHRHRQREPAGCP